MRVVVSHDSPPRRDLRKRTTVSFCVGFTAFSIFISVVGISIISEAFGSVKEKINFFFGHILSAPVVTVMTSKIGIDLAWC